ncbi:MAG: beta-galactosidase [Anaerolineae bacterium]|nr:beta-galactosidase [Anaerolineae bacterium]
MSAREPAPSSRSGWITAVLVLGIVLITLGARSVSPAPVSPLPTPWPRARLGSPQYGFQSFLWWDEQVARRDLQLIHDAGFTWVKQNVAWRDVEGAAKGHFNWYFTDRIVADAEALGLNVLFRLDREPVWTLPPEGTASDNGPPANLQDFGDFCYTLADRYRGRVRAYQVWNEPNLSREWGGQIPDPAEYVELLRVCYVGIKSADPGALVISAGLAPTGTGPPQAVPDSDYLTGMYQAGAAPYFDLLGVNAPGYRAPPEISPGEAAANSYYGNQRFFCFRHVEDLRQIMVRYSDADKQVAILEMGWTSDPHNTDYTWFAVTEQEKADYLVRAFRFARENWQPWIGPMFVLSIANPDWTPDDEQYWWSVTEPGWPAATLRPAYHALAEMEK